MRDRLPQGTWANGHTLISHALGRIDGKNYTNSREAMIHSYERGLRLFEVDVALTSDDVPVLVHGWSAKDMRGLGLTAISDDGQPMTAAQFRRARLHGTYTTMTLADLRTFMDEHDDIGVLFDIRPQSETETSRIYTRIAEVMDSPELRSRCMAGTYTKAMARTVAEEQTFRFINLYYDEGLYAGQSEFIETCVQLGIHTATISAASAPELIDGLRAAGVGIVQFTVNDPSAAVVAIDRGVTAVGTDTVSPEQVKRAGETWVRELASFKDGRGNEIVYEGVRPPANVAIRIRGRNNRLTVSAKSRLTRLDVLFDNDNAVVEIGSTRAGIPTLALRIRAGQDSRVIVGNDVTTTGSAFLSATEGTSVRVGNDVMFATSNEVRADDAHAIFDVATGDRVNVSRSIVIGDHVWFARDAVVLGGVEIGNGSVIGYRSLVTRSVPNNCIAVGTPAKPIRYDIAWERPHLDDYPPYKPTASVIEKSPYWAPTKRDRAPLPKKRSFATRVKRRLRRWLRSD